MLVGEPVLVWLHAAGAIVKVQRARSRRARTDLKQAASRRRLGKDEQLFTDNPPSAAE
jgi:hypothetical protein